MILTIIKDYLSKRYCGMLLGNDREISDYTIAVANVTAPPKDTNATIHRQQLHCNRGAVFSTRPVSRCYVQDNLGVLEVSKNLIGE
jgi:hypothetical protein